MKQRGCSEQKSKIANQCILPPKSWEENLELPFFSKAAIWQADNAIDLLFRDGKIIEFSAPFVGGVATHGTGCTYSAAITAGLARGLSLEEAIRSAKKFVSDAIAQHFRWRSKTGEVLNALRHSSLS